MAEIPNNVWDFLRENAAAIGPQLHLILGGSVILCLDFLIPAAQKRLFALFSLISLLMASGHLYLMWGSGPGSAFYDMVAVDPFSSFFNLLFLLSAVLAVIMSYQYLEVEQAQHSEYYALLLFATSGMMFMAGAIDLVSLFVGLELMSVSTYILVGFLRRQRRSNEASMKYFLLGAFSTGIILYGMSLLYGLTGSTNLHAIARQLNRLEDPTLLTLSIFMIMAGLCFKIAAVPFHMWVPDAYEGAPTSITAFMSVAVKAAGFAIFFRIFYVAFGEWRETYIFVMAVIAMSTMTWGNLAALTQHNVKRLLAYSSISHAGYVMMGLIAGTDLGVMASAIYLLAYTFMNLGIWSVVILLRRQDIPGEELEDFNGLFFKQPIVAVLLLLFFLSLAGIPPLAGFIAKYFVFAAVIEVALSPGEPHSSLMVWVAVVGAANAVISLYYYFRFVVAMFMKEDQVSVPLSFSAGLVVALVITGLLTVLMGVYPQPFIDLAQAVGLPLI
jgi:NADH-quinone oxidoreductase subunit N